MTLNKVWKKHCSAIFVSVAGIFCLSMTDTNHYEILSPDDREQELTDSEGTPALSSQIDANPYWETFNTWRCFSTENIRPECSVLDNDSLRVPTLRFAEGSTLYDFSIDPEPGLDCDETLAKWIALLDQEQSFCVYAAYLQEMPSEIFEYEGINRWQLWIVSQIKTQQGYWHLYDPEDYTSAEDGEEDIN